MDRALKYFGKRFQNFAVWMKDSRSGLLGLIFAG